MKSKKNMISKYLLLIFAFVVILSTNLRANVDYDPLIPQLKFAAEEIEAALDEVGKENLKVVLVIRPDETSPESFRIEYNGTNEIWVIGTDASGTMYGGLEVAELLRLGLPIEKKEYTPFVEKRGIKFNIPWDARTPSYDDTGDAAQRNTATIYEFEFWKEFFDDMARYRYNVLTLWGSHPYPGIVKLDDYPDVALDDVYRIAEGVFEPWHRNKLQDVDTTAPGVLELVKKISIEDKIAHWQKVFDYAGDRGIEVYLFHWNVFTYAATGKYGITQRQDNPITVDYMYQSVKQALLTYPQIKGIGVTAGENADNHLQGEYSIQNFLYNTYGKAMMDAKEMYPEREYRFIFRQHMIGLAPIVETFSDFTGELNTSFKYAIGHMYTIPRPILFEQGFRSQVEKYKVPVFFNLRNDDIFVMRWGNPDYTREYIQKMPHHLSPGFYMGSDGYVWGRESIAKHPEMSGKLEIDKHWYKFRQWGQLAYNPLLGREYWEAALRYRFPGVDAGLLYEAWASTSKVVPQLNAACYKPNDAMLAPEGCMDSRGFLTVDEYFWDELWYFPMYGSGIQSVQDYGKMVVKGETTDLITPLQVADNLDAYAGNALEALQTLKTQVGDNTELRETLNDIEGMAYLGMYYADKFRGAAKLSVFRADPTQKKYNKEAVEHLTDAIDDWKTYAEIMSSQYKTQLLQRTHYLDWNALLTEVEKEPVTVALEADYPEIKYKSMKDGERLEEGDDLVIELSVRDGHGIEEVTVFMNGLLLKADKSNPYLLNPSSDELLKSMKEGVYELETVAEDKTGVIGRKVISFYVGDATEGDAADWREAIYKVILNEGESLGDKETVEFPRLECYMGLNDDGRLVLSNGSPKNRKGQIWQPSMHRDYLDPQFVTLENGMLKIYRGTPGNVEAELFSTPEVEGEGPYKLGITVSKKLVIFREKEGRKDIVWRSH